MSARYSWLQGEKGRLRYTRLNVTPQPAPAVAQPSPEPDLASLKKDDLVALATERGIDATGTKAEIVERLNG